MKTANEKRGPYKASGRSTTIRRLRLAQGLTQPDAAKLCGVSLRTMQRADVGDVLPFDVRRSIERKLGLI